MGSTAAAAEKSEEELRREIDELLRQQRQVPFYSLSFSLSQNSICLSLILCFDKKKKKKKQITERLRDPRGLRRGGFSGAVPRNLAANGPRQRGFLRPVCTPSPLFSICFHTKMKPLLILFLGLNGFRLIGLMPKINILPNGDFRRLLSR